MDVRAFGLLLGCVWGIGVFGLGIASMMLNRWGNFVKLLSSVYIGYQATWLGSIRGAVWGFIDGLISGVVIAWIYNRFAI